MNNTIPMFHVKHIFCQKLSKIILKYKKDAGHKG